MGKITFFDLLKNILLKTGDLKTNSQFNEAFSAFMLIRYLSMKDDLLIYAQVIQSFLSAGISNDDIYDWAYANVPKQRSPFIKYLKNNNKQKDAKKK